MKRVLRCGAVTVAVVALLAGCSTSGSPKSDSANVVSVSVPADVPKDSIRDLNSTKDMSGVVTTIPSNESPYEGNLPELCNFLPKKKLNDMGFERVSVGLASTFVQQCQFVQGGISGSGASLAITDESIAVWMRSNGIVLTGNTLPIPTGQLGYEFRSASVADLKVDCGIGWGTFYGQADVRWLISSGNGDDPCIKSAELAKFLAPYLPKSPSQMRRSR